MSFKDNYSEFGESEVSEISRFSFDARDGNMSSSPIGRLKIGSLSSISLPEEDFAQGWPLLQKGNISSRDSEAVISPIKRLKRGSLSSISLPAEDFTKQRPGWPLLQTTSSETQFAVESRKMSVVQWVMTLPRRPLSEVSSESGSPLSFKTDDSLEGERMKEASLLELPKDLELILMRNPVGCRVFSLDFLKLSTSDFSSGKTLRTNSFSLLLGLSRFSIPLNVYFAIGNLIGKGGCNSVFKGVLPQGREVAVKIMESSKEAWKDFIHEVDIMTTMKHKRIAPLLGICVEDDALISVYDLMPRGNLEDNLHGEDFSLILYLEFMK